MKTQDIKSPSTIITSNSDTIDDNKDMEYITRKYARNTAPNSNTNAPTPMMLCDDDISAITNDDTFSTSASSKRKTATMTKTRDNNNNNNAFLRLYNTPTKAQTQNRWSVYKRVQEERKKKIVPKDNEFLSYGTTIINQNPPRKHCSPTISRLKLQKQRSFDFNLISSPSPGSLNSHKSKSRKRYNFDNNNNNQNSKLKKSTTTNVSVVDDNNSNARRRNQVEMLTKRVTNNIVNRDTLLNNFLPPPPFLQEKESSFPPKIIDIRIENSTFKKNKEG